MGEGGAGRGGERKRERGREGERERGREGEKEGGRERGSEGAGDRGIEGGSGLERFGGGPELCFQDFCCPVRRTGAGAAGEGAEDGEGIRGWMVGSRCHVCLKRSRTVAQRNR